MYTPRELRCSLNDEVLLIRCIQPNDVNLVYVNSLNNEKKYLETKSDWVTIYDQKRYVVETISAIDRFLLGLFHRNELIGTSGGQAISRNEFSLGIFIFDSWRGCGFGKILVWMASRFLIQEINGLILRAGMKIDNHKSLNSFLKCGFSLTETSETHYSVVLDSRHLKLPGEIGLFDIV